MQVFEHWERISCTLSIHGIMWYINIFIDMDYCNILHFMTDINLIHAAGEPSFEVKCLWMYSVQIYHSFMKQLHIYKDTGQPLMFICTIPAVYLSQTQSAFWHLRETYIEILNPTLYFLIQYSRSFHNLITPKILSTTVPVL